ncbi:hypothetical protein D3C80_1598130 [compost metagenome]
MADLACALTGVPFRAGVLGDQHDGANATPLLFDGLFHPGANVGVGWVEPGPWGPHRRADEVAPVNVQGVDIRCQVLLAERRFRQGGGIEGEVELQIQSPE